MLVDRIGLLVTNEPDLGEGTLGLIRDAAVVIDGDTVAWVGAAADVPEAAGEERLDADGRCVIPGFVDAHTHLVFAGDRAEEFAARVSGRDYEAGGIRTTVHATRAARFDALLAAAQRLAAEALRHGTTTLEVKSGYGLNVQQEARSLAVAHQLGRDPQLPDVHATFLGAHVVPREYEADADGYVDLVCGPMVEACAPLARSCDVFCDRGAFDAEQSRRVLQAGRAHGLVPRVHANQLGPGAGAQLAAELGAASADHCNHLSDADIGALASAGVVATLLPVADLCTRAPAPPAQRLLDAGATLALATDCNPGTSYTTSMPLVIALACTRLALTPEQALAAATAGGAQALGLDNGAGHVRPGGVADLALLDAPSYIHLAYRPGVTLVSAVMRAGQVLATRVGTAAPTTNW